MNYPPITYSLLIEKEACPAQLALFKKHFGEIEAIPLTKEVAAKFCCVFDIHWAARNLLTKKDLDEYIRDASFVEYDKVSAPAMAEYNKVIAHAREEYVKVRDTAYAEYHKVRATDADAWAEYEKVRDTAWAEYMKVKVTAGAEYMKATSAASEDFDKDIAHKFVEIYKRGLMP